MRTTHDTAVYRLWRQLRAEGHLADTEVGVPGGRVDVVRVNREMDWLEFYEVKVRAAESGVAQLERYGARAPGVRLTLVVPPSLVTPDLRLLAKDWVSLWAFDFAQGVQESLFESRWIDLHYFHPESLKRKAAA